MYYRSTTLGNGLTFDWNSLMIQNQLLNGLQNKLGLSIPFMGNGFIHANIELYTFGFGKNWYDYIQKTFSASLSKRVGKHLNTYMSFDLSKDAEFIRSFWYFGLTYRF